MHRLRIKFCRKEQLKFLSHLDLMRLWERALRRAGTPPAYSEGFSPHARISLAAPLAVGVIGREEMMDVFLPGNISAMAFTQKVGPQLPEGIGIVEVWPVSVELPSLQSLLRFAEYRVEIETGSNSRIESEIASLIAREQFPWHHTRDTGERYYDLRTLIHSLWLIENNGSRCSIGMRLRCDASGSGRPEQVVRALGFTEPPLSIERTKLIFAGTFSDTVDACQ